MIENLLAEGLKENADISGFSDIERRLKKDHRALVMYNAVALDINLRNYTESDLRQSGIGELTKLEKRIKEGIKLSQDYARNKIMLRVAKKQLRQIGELNHNYSALLVETANRLFAEFAEVYGQMKKLKDVDEIKSKRKHLKHLADLYGEISILAEPRRVKLGDMPDAIGIFVRNSYEIKKLKKEREDVGSVKKEMESLDLNNRRSRKQLKACSKKLKRLPEKFARVEYYEGIIEANMLMQQIEYLRSSNAHVVWTDLCKYVDALRTDIQHVAHEKDLDKLRKLSTGLNFQRYDDYTGVIPFKEKIQEYRKLVQKFYDSVADKIINDDSREKAQLKCQADEAQKQAKQESETRRHLEQEINEAQEKIQQAEGCVVKTRQEYTQMLRVAQNTAAETKGRYKQRLASEQEKVNGLLSEKQELEKKLEEEKGDFFYLGEDYVNQKKPTHNEFKALGKIIVSSYCGDVVKKFRRIHDYVNFLSDSNVQTDKEDAAYIQHICDGVRLSLEKGNLSIELDNLNGDSEVIYSALEGMETFIGNTTIKA